jgi:cytochrome c-type biogenesis protein CcmH
VLLKPPVKPYTWGLWFGPLAVLLVAGGGIALYLRRRPPRERANAPLTPEERARLDALLREAPGLDPTPPAGRAG